MFAPISRAPACLHGFVRHGQHDDTGGSRPIRMARPLPPSGGHRRTEYMRIRATREKSFDEIDGAERRCQLQTGPAQHRGNRVHVDERRTPARSTDAKGLEAADQDMVGIRTVGIRTVRVRSSTHTQPLSGFG